MPISVHKKFKWEGYISSASSFQHFYSVLASLVRQVPTLMYTSFSCYWGVRGTGEQESSKFRFREIHGYGTKFVSLLPSPFFFLNSSSFRPRMLPSFTLPFQGISHYLLSTFFNHRLLLLYCRSASIFAFIDILASIFHENIPEFMGSTCQIRRFLIREQESFCLSYMNQTFADNTRSMDNEEIAAFL